jgi:hypothetical protein
MDRADINEDIYARSALSKLDGVRVHQLVAKPSEILFIPLGWRHQVSSLDLSVAITHTNFRWRNDFYCSA